MQNHGQLALPVRSVNGLRLLAVLVAFRPHSWWRVVRVHIRLVHVDDDVRALRLQLQSRVILEDELPQQALPLRSEGEAVLDRGDVVVSKAHVQSVLDDATREPNARHRKQIMA